MFHGWNEEREEISHWADLMSLITPLKPFKRKHKISVKEEKN
jgi:hypothetical protein